MQQIHYSSERDPLTFMKRDEQLLHRQSENALSLLHFYRWPPFCITYGRFIPIEHYLSPLFLQNHASLVARRPTGGGITFHGHDFSFSFLSSHPQWQGCSPQRGHKRVHRWICKILSATFSLPSLHLSLALQSEVAEQIQERRFCSTYISLYDLLYKGKKVGSSSQKRNSHSVLYQITLFVTAHNPLLIEKSLLERKSKWICKRMKEKSGALWNQFSTSSQEKLMYSLVNGLHLLMESSNL